MDSIYHVRHYSGDGTKDTMAVTLSSAKEWVEERNELGSIDWMKYDDHWRGFSTKGPQVGEIHEREIGSEFSRF